MNWKKYIPSSTQAVQVFIVMVALGAIGAVAWGTNWVRVNLLGRV